VPYNSFLPSSQELGEQWIKEGKKRSIPGGGSVEEYKRVNREESIQLADAFLSYPFLNVSSLCLFNAIFFFDVVNFYFLFISGSI